MFSTTVSERPSTAPSAQSNAKASLKAWAKSTESTIAKFDSLSLSEKLKKYKELQLKTAALNMPRKAWGIVSGSNQQNGNGGTESQTNSGKSSTASWIIEVKKEALLREQKRKLKSEQDALEKRRLELESNSTSTEGAIIEEQHLPAKIIATKKVEKHLSVNVDATRGGYEANAQTPNPKKAGFMIDIPLDNLFVPEYPWKAPVLIIGSEVASATPSLAEFGCKEDVSLMNDS